MHTTPDIDWADQLRGFLRITLERGVRIRIGSDFSHFKWLACNHPEKNGVNPAFDPDCSALTSRNAFWLTGHAKDGSLVHMQAMKCLDLRGNTLNSYLRTNLYDLRIGRYDVDVKASRWHLTRAAAAINGLVTYHGELWIKGGPQGFRGGCLAAVLTRLMMVIGMLKWNPDYMIGLQAPMTSCRGLACREGYAHIEQRSILWKRNDDEPLLEDWLVWMSLEEAQFNLRLPPDFFVELFETTPSKPKLKIASAAHSP